MFKQGQDFLFEIAVIRDNRSRDNESRLYRHLGEYSGNYRWNIKTSEHSTPIQMMVLTEVFVYMRCLCLTNCILVDSSTVIFWTSPFVILGVSVLFCRFYPIFDEKTC